MQGLDLNKVIKEQSSFFYLHKYFSTFCKNSPKLRERFDKRTNKIYKTWHFSTLSLPLFTEFYNLFYKNKKKIVPINIIDLIDPVSLAFFIMCDGYNTKTGVALATNAFSNSDNELLIKALNKKFEFNSWIIDDHGLPSIYIPKSNLISLQNLISPYIHFTLLYKIHL